MKRRGMNDDRRTGLVLMTALILLVLTVLPADAARLMYIRVGEYESLTRIVFEFDGTVKFRGPEIKGPGQITVDFLDTTTTNPALQKMRDRSGHIEKIEFIQGAALLTANVGLTSSSFNLKTFYLYTPDRLVLDLYWTAAPAPSVAAAAPAPERAPEAASAPPAPENVPPGTADPRSVKPPETAALAKEAETSLPGAATDSGQLQSYLSMALIGLSVAAVMIALLATFAFMKKRRRDVSPKNRAALERTGRTMDEQPDAESIRALDSKIRDELNKYGK